MRPSRRCAAALLGSAVILLALPAHASATTGIPYRVAGGETLELDAFIPDEPGPHPAAVLIHGGGFTRGSRASLAGLGRWLADRGTAAFAIDYRLAPAHRYPAGVEDARAAVRWIRTNATSYRVDPTRIAAFGLSAGGYIATMLGTLGEGALDRDARVRVAVAWSAPLDLASPQTRSMAEPFIGCGDCMQRLREASPAAHVDSSDAAIVLANSTKEAQPIDGAVRLDRILARAGVPSLLIRVGGAHHAGEYGGVALSRGGDTVLEASARYMRIWFDQPRLPTVESAPVIAREPFATGLALLAFLGGFVVATVLLAGRHARDGWFDPAAMAMMDTLGAAGASAGEIEATIRLRAPLGVRRRRRG